MMEIISPFISKFNNIFLPSYDVHNFDFNIFLKRIGAPLLNTESLYALKVSPFQPELYLHSIIEQNAFLAEVHYLFSVQKP